MANYNPNTHDYLKYWRVVKRFIMKKHDISLSDLEMLLFLYSEVYFGNKEFQEYERLMSWEKDRVYRMMQEGYVEVFREHNHGTRTKKLYQLTNKSKKIVRELYKTLDKNEFKWVEKAVPPKYKRRHKDLIYRDYMHKINEETKQQRHLSPE
jgi:hypothetical protein